MIDIAQALKPYGYDYLVSATGIPGPGNTVVVFATRGDFLTACVSHDNKVIWVLSCGGTADEEAHTPEANELHRASRALFGGPPHDPWDDLRASGGIWEGAHQPVRERPVVAKSNEHHWIEAFDMICCRDCMKVRRADDKNPPCKGPAKLDLRGSSSDLAKYGESDQ